MSREGVGVGRSWSGAGLEGAEPVLYLPLSPCFDVF